MELSQPAGGVVGRLAGVQDGARRALGRELEVERVVEHLDRTARGFEATLGDPADAPALLRAAARRVGR